MPSDIRSIIFYATKLFILVVEPTIHNIFMLRCDPTGSCGLLGPNIYGAEHIFAHLEGGFNSPEHPMPVLGHFALDIHIIGVVITDHLRGDVQIPNDLR